MKIKKKSFFLGGGSGGGVGKFTKKWGEGREGVLGGGLGWWGIRVDVNAMLGVRGDVGYGNQE